MYRALTSHYLTSGRSESRDGVNLKFEPFRVMTARTGMNISTSRYRTGTNCAVNSCGSAESSSVAVQDEGHLFVDS